MLEKVIGTIVIIAILALLGWALVGAINKTAILECNKLLRQSKEYPKFWITPYEKQACYELGIDIDAPIGNSYDYNN